MNRMNRMISLLLALVMLVSLTGTAFATQGQETKAATKGSSDLIVGDWLFTDTIVNRGINGAAAIMEDYAAAGVTDVYLLCKGISGRLAWASKVAGTVRSSSTRDYLKEACDAAKPYGIRVHAWMMASRDTHYVTNIDSNSPFYHFRVGLSTSVNQYINLRDAGYQNYMTSLVKELVANYDIAGIHLDTIRYGALYYDWGLNARTELINNYGITKAEYNAATKAMCVTGGYAYTTNSEGYYVYSSSGSAASGVGFASALAGGGSTDALNGAKKFAQMRKDTITNFVKKIRAAAGSNAVISCAIMPEPCTSSYESALYGQSPEGLGSVVDYVAVMSYSSEYNTSTTWPVTLTTACTKVGCNAIAGIQTYPSEGSSDPDPTGQTVYEETYNIRKAMESNSGIRGYAFFRGSFTDLAGAKYVNANTIDVRVAPGDDASSATKYVFTLQNGMTCSAISNKTGWASGTSFAISSDKKTITISNGGSTILAKNNSASFRMTVSGTVNETLGIAKLRSYHGSGYSEGYGYCGTVMPKHTHSYTSTVTKAATCSAEGTKTYTCECGHSYTEAIAKTAHSYSSTVNSSTGATTYTCKVCKYSFTTACGNQHSRIETWMKADRQHTTICYDCKQGITEKCVFEEFVRVNPTATTDGYITYICVGSGSMSAELSHDAFSGRGCGRTYKVILPKGSGYTYKNNHNGTHTRTGVDSDVTETNLAHVYVNGKCACGEVARNFLMLHFAENSPVNQSGFWSTNAVRGEVIAEESVYRGVASGKDPYIKLEQIGESINYKISKGDIVEVRMKSDVISGSAKKMQFFYSLAASKGYSEAKSVSISYTPTAKGSYQTLRFALTKDIGSVINALRLDPFSDCSEKFCAKFDLDYIYVGSPEQAPSTFKNQIFMDFTNDNAAAARYLATDIYSGFNYDQAYWVHNSKRSTKPVIDTDAGTLSFSVAPTTDSYGSTGFSPYVQTTDTSNRTTAIPLNYVPGSSDVVQIRVRFENCAVVPNGNPRIRLYYIKNNDDGSEGVDGADYVNFIIDPADLTSGQWVTYTLNAPTAFKEASVINAVRPLFNAICSASGKTGKITIDYIFVGARRDAPDQGDLFIDFNNKESDKQRYNSKTYGYLNFDRADGVENWYAASVNISDLTIDNAAGTMNLTAAGSFAADKYPDVFVDTTQGGAYHSYPLSYRPQKAEVLQVRFKMENFKVGTQMQANGTEKTVNPYLLMTYFIDGINDTHSACAGAPIDVETITSGRYVTMTVPLNDEFRGQEEIQKLRIFFGGIESLSASTPGKISIDYIFVGQKDNAPVHEALYFDFANTAADKERYSSKTYSAINYDDPKGEHWYYYKDVNTVSAVIDNAAGTMTLNAVGQLEDTRYPCLYVDTAQSWNYHSYPLNYEPANAEVFQVRFKMENFRVGDQVAADGTVKTSAPYVNMSYFINGENQTYGATANGLKFDESYLTSGKYITLTVDLKQEFRDRANIDKIRFFFGGIESISAAKPGKLTIDYIYVGPKATMPVREELYIGFGHTADALERYSSQTYGGVNYDDPKADNWFYSKDVTLSSIAIDNAAGTMTLNAVGQVADATRYPGLYLDTIKNGSYHSYPLKYNPSKAEIYQVRFKMENLRVGDQTTADGTVKTVKPYVLLSYFVDGENKTYSANSAAFITEQDLTSGKYITVTAELNDTFRSRNNIDKLRFFFGGMESISAQKPGKLTVDYFYVGPRENAPSASYTVTFVGADGKTLATKIVSKGGTAVYDGATPKKASDGNNHYSFKGWDKALTNITANVTVTAQFTATAHKYSYAKVDATNHKASCSCGYNKTVAHTWDAGTVTTAASCTATGKMTYTCTGCKATKTALIAAKEHTKVVDKAVAPTCTAAGKTEGSHCSVCKTVIVAQQTVPATGHSYNSGVTTTQPTCTSSGIKTYTCTVCKATKTETVAAKGHTKVVDKAVAATCTTAGKTEGSHCSTCNAVLVAQQTIPAKGHTKVVDKAVAATCTTAGKTEGSHCSTCNAVLVAQQTIPATGHTCIYSYTSDTVHTVSCVNCGYKAEEGHSFTNGGCVCGVEENIDPVTDESIKINHTLDLASDISLKYLVAANLLSDYDVNSVYMELSVKEYEGNKAVGTAIHKLYPELVNGYYYFVLEGMTAVRMNDEVNATLYGVKNGTLCRSKTDVYSIATYAYSQLNKTGSTAELKTLCADLLRYGAAAQTFKSYRTDAMADGRMTATHKSCLTDLDTVSFGNNNRETAALDNAPIRWVGKSLDLNSKVTLKYIFDISSYAGDVSALSLRVNYYSHTGEKKSVILAAAEKYGANESYYCFNFDGLLAAELRQVVSVAVYNGNERLSSVLQYSADTYGNNKTGTLLTLCKSLFAYSDSALAYFK